MKSDKFAIPEFATEYDFKRIRNKLNMSQQEFALFIGTSKPTVERWEKQGSKVTGPVVLLINMIENNIDYVEKLKIPEKKYPTRLFYMMDNHICTIIDVDDLKQKVSIINYTNNLMFRAFGKIENPSYKEYEEFLKSRCFPETRDKLKLVLENLGVPFYDPFLIIKKTEGRMAEDNFWIKIEE